MSVGKILILFILALAISSLGYTQSDLAASPATKPNFTGRPATRPNFTGQRPNPSSSISPYQPKFVENRVIVKFKSNSTSASIGAPQTQDTASSGLSQEAVSALSSIQGSVTKTFRTIGVNVVQTPLKVGKAIETLYRSGAVEYAEPDFKVHALATPNDPLFNSLWGLNNIGQDGGVPDADIDAPEAWDIRKDGSNVIVGVIDTGVDYTHPDLKLNMWRNPKEIPGNRIDDDHNGWVDDVYGIDAINDDADPMDDHSHGTHVSGTIGARGDNNEGVAGVAWKAKIMALKFLDSGGSGDTSDAIEAINYALQIKAANNYPRMILSNSWGGGEYSQALYDAIKMAQDKGVLFIAAAGNDGMDTDQTTFYPSGYNLPNIMSIGANDSSDELAYFSNYGCGSVDVFAPGVDTLSTVPGGGYASKSGTSMATPHVSGMLALIWANNPGRSWKAVKSALLNSVDQLDSMSQASVSQGRVNLNKALQPGAISKPAPWSVTPPLAKPGTVITITGFNFGGAPGRVEFEGAPLTVLAWTNVSIMARVEADIPKRGTGTLKVIGAADNRSDAGACFEVAALKPSLYKRTLTPRAWASGAQVGNNFWIIGGETYWGVTGIVEAVTLPSGVSAINSTWMMPTPLSNSGAAAIGSRIYVVGGYEPDSDKVYNTLQIFDTVSKTWSLGAPLPQPLMQVAVAAVGGKLYAFGGQNAGLRSINTTYIYDPTTNSWSTGKPKPTPVSYATATKAAGDGKVLVAGGSNCPDYGCELTVVEQYDTVSNAWTAAPPLNAPRAGAAGAYYRNRHYALFGSDKNTSGEYYDGAAWGQIIKDGPPLYTSMGAVGPDGATLFILDGYNQSKGEYSANIWTIKE